MASGVAPGVAAAATTHTTPNPLLVHSLQPYMHTYVLMYVLMYVLHDMYMYRSVPLQETD